MPLPLSNQGLDAYFLLNASSSWLKASLVSFEVVTEILVSEYWAPASQRGVVTSTTGATLFGRCTPATVDTPKNG